MKAINVNDIQILKSKAKGTFSKVFIVLYEGKTYCYKQFVHPYADNTAIEKICDFTDIEFSQQFLSPIYMVESNEKGVYSGYLSRYDENLVSIFYPFSRKERIAVLKSVRNNLEILHKDYNIVHGDLHLKNILCNKNNLQSSILDFDFAQRLGNVPSSFGNYGLAIQEYIKYYPFDYNADVYYFNLSTFKLLIELEESYKDTIETIDSGKYYFSEINSDVKRLTKELVLDPRKLYSGEYIIDYID